MEPLIAVCKPILRVNLVSTLIFFIQAYPVSSFAYSADLQFQTLTGDADVGFAVRLDVSFFWSATRPHSIFF